MRSSHTTSPGSSAAAKARRYGRTHIFGDRLQELVQGVDPVVEQIPEVAASFSKIDFVVVGYKPKALIEYFSQTT